MKMVCLFLMVTITLMRQIPFLKTPHILGNLYLASGIGDGSVALTNVIVDGIVFIQGGGLKTVKIHNCRFEEVRVNRPDGRVRLVASGETVIEYTSLETGVRLLKMLTTALPDLKLLTLLLLIR
jgi:hypothetical protein